jgi:hypothetical protein
MLAILDEYTNAGKPLNMPTLGARLQQKFPGEKPVHKRLGFATLSHLLARLPSIEVVGEMTAASVRRRT